MHGRKNIKLRGGVPCECDEGVVGSEVTEPLTSNLRAGWGQWWASRPGRFTLEERAPTPGIH